MYFLAVNTKKDFPSMEEVERALIIDALRKFNFNRTQAAKALGTSIRNLRAKIYYQYDLEPLVRGK